MARRGTVAEIRLWGARIGAVSWDPDRELGTFEYAPEFRDSGRWPEFAEEAGVDESRIVEIGRLHCRMR